MIRQSLKGLSPLFQSNIHPDRHFLENFYNGNQFEQIERNTVKVTLIGDIRQVGLTFPQSFCPARFIHNPINNMGMEQDNFIFETMSAAIESNLSVSAEGQVFILSITDLFTFTYKTESEFYQIARAYKVLSRCLSQIMDGTNHKALILLPMALSDCTEMDLVAAQGLGLVQAILMDSDFRKHVSHRIRFFSVLNYMALRMENGNLHDRVEFNSMFQNTRKSGCVLSHDGNKNVSYELSNFISSWVMNLLDPVFLTPNQSMEDMLADLEKFSVVFPFRKSDSLPEVAERFRLEHGFRQQNRHAPPSHSGDRHSKEKVNPPPLMLGAPRSGRGKKRAGPHQPPRAGPHQPPRPGYGRAGPPPFHPWKPRNF